MNLREGRDEELTLWKRIWSQPDPQLADAGFIAEYFVAGVRLLLVVLLLYIPLTIYGPDFSQRGFQVLIAAIGAAMIEALLVYSAVQRNWGRSWLGFASSLTDVTLVSGGLVVFLILDQPLAATNSMVVYPFYLLTISATSLRYDSRICVLTGVVAIAEYVAILAYANAKWPLQDPAFSSNEFGRFSMPDQWMRLILLIAATILATTLVVRARETSTLSIRDRLTGLLNRRVFDHRLEAEAARASRNNRTLGVAMLDVDRFKQFNDTYGHEGGDEALRVIGELLMRSFRATDVVARYGGEEFAVILPAINFMNAYRRMENLRIAVAQMPIVLRGKTLPVGITVSVGVAIWPLDYDDIHQVVATADARLYQAKHAGRNRVVCPIEIDVPVAPGEEPTEAEAARVG